VRCLLLAASNVWPHVKWRVFVAFSVGRASAWRVERFFACIAVLEWRSALDVLLQPPAGWHPRPGCGHSEGAYVSLGHHEAADLAAVVADLRARRPVAGVVAWGRSMGAVTSSQAPLGGCFDPSPLCPIDRLALHHSSVFILCSFLSLNTVNH